MTVPEYPYKKSRRPPASEAETQAGTPAKSITEAATSPRKPHPLPPVALDENNMPLPRRVEEVDVEATRVAEAAYVTGATGRRRSSRPRRSSPLRIRQPFDWQRAGGCLLRGGIVLIFILVAIGLILTAFGMYEYYAIASTLPSVSDLKARASQFETTRILDRNGNILYEIIDPHAGRRTYTPLEEISPNLVAATIAIEDKDFYSHKGFDPLAIVRAFLQNLRSGETVSGASTITQQLGRALLFTPEERNQRTYMRKVREAILAAEIERRYSKDEILELYLNEIYYGNLSYGVEAAAETYFGKTAAQLTLAEAAFLAGLPQAPSVYDIYTNRDATLMRNQSVVMAMLALSLERHCIYVSNFPQPVCVDGAAAADAINQIKNYNFVPPTVDMRYPHWVQYIRTLLEDRFDAQTIYRSGFNVYTTLDPVLQDAAQQAVTNQIAALTEKHVTDGALVAIKPSTGEILTMVGSPDFYNEAAAGQINMAVSPTRHPGSSIKPLTYLAAFEKGWTPATLIWDVPSSFPPSGLPNDPNPPYIPVNYSHRFLGPVRLRMALANSLNVPAVKALQFVGVYGEGGLIEMAKRLGITSLTRNDYGLSLTLGGGEVSLLEMTGAFSVIANGGLKIPPVAILKIVDYQGKTIYEYSPPAGEQVLRPEHAFLMASILSDNAARAPVFGRNSVLNLPFQAAVKTGTSDDSRDNWTIGFTPDLTVGVWVGNADYSPMVGTTGVTGAGPIWAEVMTFAINYLKNGNPTPFIAPPGIVQHTICSVSGTQPSRWCPSQQEEYFAFDQPPLPPEEDLWREVQIDTWTNLLSSPECADFTDRRLALNVTDQSARDWISSNEHGKQWARDMGFETVFFVPQRQCKASDPRPRLEFIGLESGQVINQTSLDITIVADATANFRLWRLEWGAGARVAKWIPLLNNVTQPVSSPTTVYTWDLRNLPSGPITLRLYMLDVHNGYAEKRLLLNLDLPTPTPTLTPSLTPTPSPSDTATPSPTLTETPTLPSTPTATPTFSPTSTGTPSETATPGG